MVQTLQCYKCGNQNKLGLHFCTTCGEKFFYRCPQCSANVEPGNEYCSYCSVRLNWGIVPEQQTAISSGQVELTNNERWEIKKYKSKRREATEQLGGNPWLIALIITVILIIVIFVIDKMI